MEPAASARWSDTAPLSPLDKILLEEHNNRPVPRVALRGARFLATVLVGAGVVVGILVAIRSSGLALERGVEDVLGSSANASAHVSLFQTVNGFVWAGVALLLEQYFRVFLAALVVFFGNAKWHPRDTPRDGERPTYKRLALLALPSLAMFVVNLGLTSVFIEHKPTDVRRAFVDQDLVRVTGLSRTPPLEGEATSRARTRDTVLRAAVTGQVVPFKLNESITCRSNGAVDVANTDRELILGSTAPTPTPLEPSIVEIEATSVAYAFPTRDWYEQALPQALEPKHSITFVARDIMEAGDTAAKEESRFRTFVRNAEINLTTVHELLVQGLTSFGKAASSSNAYLDYPCDVIDHKSNSVNESSDFELYGSESK